MRANRVFFYLLAMTVVFPAVYGKAVFGADLKLFFDLFERCRVSIETSLPFDNYGLEFRERKYRKNDGDYIQCDVTKYATDDVFLVGVFSCNDTEWDESRFFCSVYISPESREENRFNPIALAEIFELEYRHLDDLGSHEIDFDATGAFPGEAVDEKIGLDVVGTNQRGCPVFSYVKISKNGSEIVGTSSESLVGKCDYKSPD